MADVVLKDIFGIGKVYRNIDTVSLNTENGEIATFVSDHLIRNQMQSDWRQTDNTQPDYIKNRPFYDDGITLVEVAHEIEVPFNFDSDKNVYMISMPIDSEITDIYNSNDWTEATIVWDEMTYITKSQTISGRKLIGNLPLFIGVGDNEEPFMMTVMSKEQSGNDSDVFIIYSLLDESPDDHSTVETIYHNISLTFHMRQIVKVPQKYLYQPDWNEMDKTNGSYIENKPFGTYSKGTVLFNDELMLFNTSTSSDDIVIYSYIGNSNLPIPIKDKLILEFTIDGNTYQQSSSDILNSDNENWIVFKLLFDNNDNIEVKINSKTVVVVTSNSIAPKVIITMPYDFDITIPEKYLPKGFGLPKVATNDVGKFLRVDANGQWIAELIPSAEGASF